MICASVEAAAGTLQRSENFDQSEELYCIRFLLFFIVLHFFMFKFVDLIVCNVEGVFWSHRDSDYISW